MTQHNDKASLLLQIYQADRDELLKRVQQRDSYVIQYILSIGAILCANRLFDSLLILVIPFLSLYFKYQTVCSYRVHEKLVKHIKLVEEYLRTGDILDGSCLPAYLFWQTYADGECPTTENTLKSKSRENDVEKTDQNDKTRQKVSKIIFDGVSVISVMIFVLVQINVQYQPFQVSAEPEIIKLFSILGIAIIVLYVFINWRLIAQESSEKRKTCKNKTK